MKALRTIVIPALLLLVGSVAGYRFGKGEFPTPQNVSQSVSQYKRLTETRPPTDRSEVDFGAFWEVWKRLENQYLDAEKLDAQKMVHGAIRGMVDAVGDPYTVYLPPEEQKRSEEDLGGAFDGVGIQLGYKNNTLAVIAPLKEGSAIKAGIKAGDLILRIKDPEKNVDRDTAGISLPEAVNLIRGKKGTKVLLTMMREGAQPEEKELIRDTIVIPSVELKMIDNGGKKYAHLILSKFGDRTEKEWSDAVSKILAERPKVAGVVLDLRNNTGGYLTGAIDVASEFIPGGVIVTQQGRTDREDYSVTRRGRLTDLPTVILVNRGSASASEIVSGALRDRRKIKLVGENTFGKGTVQDAMSDLPDGAGLHVTVARWLLPSGSWIHEKGLSPDVSILDDEKTTDKDEALEKALESL